MASKPQSFTRNNFKNNTNTYTTTCESLITNINTIGNELTTILKNITNNASLKLEIGSALHKLGSIIIKIREIGCDTNHTLLSKYEHEK
jgi:hypothetical protein